MLYYCCIMNELVLSFCVGNFNCINYYMHNFAAFNLVYCDVSYKFKI